MSDQEDSFKFPVFLESNAIKDSEIPEKTRAKIITFDSTYDEYEKSESGSTEEKDFYAKLCALDSGILSDLQTYIAEKGSKPPQAAEGGQTSTTPSGTATTPPSPDAQSDTPSWRFWM